MTGPADRRCTALALVACLALFGCGKAQPLVLRGDANSVEVTRTGNIEGATAMARNHCSRFEKVPRLIDGRGDELLFDCVRP